MQTMLPTPDLSVSLSPKQTKPYACTICTQRKVKCDKHYPCMSCTKSRLRCEYRSTPPPPRRKRKLDDSQRVSRPSVQGRTISSPGPAFGSFCAVVSPRAPSPRVYNNDRNNAASTSETTVIERQHEQALPSNRQPSISATSTAPSNPGILVAKEGGGRYYEQDSVGSIGQEYMRSDGPQYEASDILAASILTGLPSVDAVPQHHHLPEPMVQQFWSTFLRNVHPLTKIIHPPTIQATMFTVTSPRVVKESLALRYSIYACAISSMTEDECIRYFGESQHHLLHRYQTATRFALLESSFLSIPDMDLLRANVLLLTSMLSTSDSCSLWILMGSTIRMAQSQGLHRDGATLNLSPFDTEMRRRLWWYMVTLDTRLAELTGSQSSLPKSTDTLLPSNVDDNEIGPEMTAPPEPRPGTSEMTFCLMKYEIARFMQQHDPGILSEKRSLSDLEKTLETKFLRFCDPIVPVDFMTTTVARSAICKLRQMVQYRRARPNPDGVLAPTSDWASIANVMAIRNLKYHNLIYSIESLRGFLWMANFQSPWAATICILKNLASCQAPWDEEMPGAWIQIEELYRNHPEYMNTDKGIFLIVSGLTLKAWSSQEIVLQARGLAKHSIPAVIIELQTKRAALMSSRGGAGNEGGDANNTRFANGGIDFSSMDIANQGFTSVDMSGFDTIYFANNEFGDAGYGPVGGWSCMSEQQDFLHSLGT